MKKSTAKKDREEKEAYHIAISKTSTKASDSYWGGSSNSAFIQTFKKVAYVALIILTCECVIGSSGRWLEIGPLSIRMWLFVLAFLLSVPFVIIRYKSIIRNPMIIAILIFVIILLAQLFHGYIKGNNRSFMAADLTSMAFIAIVPAYMVIFDDDQKIKSLLKAASYTSMFLVIVTVILHFVFAFIDEYYIAEVSNFTNAMSLGGFFHFGDGIHRLYFRSSICFVLPLIYFYNEVTVHNGEEKNRPIVPYVFMSLCLIAIILTYTRSVWLGMFVGILLFIIFNIRKFKVLLKSFLITLAGFLVIVALSWISYGFEGVITNAVDRVLLSRSYQSYHNPKEDKDTKDDLEDRQRLIQFDSEKIREERFKLTYSLIEKNLFVGTGLGLVIDDQNGAGEGKIEYTYLDVLSKLGVIGLLVFLGMLLYPYRHVFVLWREKELNQSIQIAASVMACILIASIYNPFLTSPIGFSMYAVFLAAINAKLRALKDS